MPQSVLKNVENNDKTVKNERRKSENIEIFQSEHDQIRTDIKILKCLNNKSKKFEENKHLKYIVESCQKRHPEEFEHLDAHHPWMVYWILNSYQLIKKNDNCIWNIERNLVLDKIERCIINDGREGIAGGTNQIGHVASTYASVLSLILIEEYDILNRIKKNLYSWFLKLKQKDGSFSMHVNGECDMRAIYCVLCVCKILNLITPELTENTLEWILSCQTYEGGFGNIPHAEAHGGYTFCALSNFFFIFKTPTQMIEHLQNTKKFNLKKLIRWAVMRQSETTGGLNGRTNKLVDSCYGFWIGSLFPILKIITHYFNKNERDLSTDFFDRKRLKNYIIQCCQYQSGGMIDKPGKRPDFYHTNYALCGLCISEFDIDILKFDFSTTDISFECNLTIACNPFTVTTSFNPLFGLPSRYIPFHL